MSEYDRFIINDSLWALTAPTGVPVYDFNFRQFFDCRTPYQPPSVTSGVARTGAFPDYGKFYDECRDTGITLVHSPEEHERCSYLQHWYPLIEKLTPRSRWYGSIPSFDEITAEFELPVFIKGSRQTSRHQAAASIIRSRDDYERAAQIFQSDSILRWQNFVCREYVPLKPVPGGVEGKIPPSYEFRTFWWRGKLVGDGRYWYESPHYTWIADERSRALTVAEIAVQALRCDFLVVDLALTQSNKWIVIECNDGMESGYAGVSPFVLWQNILEIEGTTKATAGV